LCGKKKIEFSVFFVVFKIQKSRGRNMKVGDGGRKGGEGDEQGKVLMLFLL
jgi:hypothetical protein